MSNEKNATEIPGPEENPNAGTVSTEAKAPTGEPEGESTQETQSEQHVESIPDSEVYPQKEFAPVIEKSFDAMIKDFNHFKNNAKTEDVKALYLKAIMSLTKSKNEVLSAVNADIETRK